MENCPARLARGRVHRIKIEEAFGDPFWIVAVSTILSGREHFLLCLDMLAQIRCGCLPSSDPQRPSLGPLGQKHHCFPPSLSPSFDCSSRCVGIRFVVTSQLIRSAALSLICSLLCYTWKWKTTTTTKKQWLYKYGLLLMVSIFKEAARGRSKHKENEQGKALFKSRTHRV